MKSTSEYDYQMEDPFLEEQEERQEGMRQYYETLDNEAATERSRQENYEYMLKCCSIVEAMTVRAISMLAEEDSEQCDAIANNSMHMFIGMIGLTISDPRVQNHAN